MGISRQELLRLARTGAYARVKELQAELETIFRTFPDLRSGGSRRTAAQSTAQKKVTRSQAKRAWSAADRKAVSERMKRYWAARRGKTSKAAKT